MKKLINAVDTVVTDALTGMAAAHPDTLTVDTEQHIIYRATAKEDGKVAIVSGGGSGHEPLHGGFVGQGMLDAACAGQIFTSPVPDQIQRATASPSSLISPIVPAPLSSSTGPSRTMGAQYLRPDRALESGTG